MAPKVCVPADFGRHHIGAPSHGNLTFNLAEGVQIKANSIILSLNSPVIDNLLTDLHLTSLEAEDFSREAVDCFIEASYTGEIEAVTVGNFRGVNKMSRVFEVNWLVARCEKYFVSYLEKLDSESSYPDILFAVEEAVYLMSSGKKRDFLDLVLHKMSFAFSSAFRGSFIVDYLFDVGNCAQIKLDACIAIVKDDLHVLVNVLIAHLEKQGFESLDANSKYLLRNIDLSACFANDPSLRTKLFASLECIENVGKEEYQLFVALHKQLTSRHCTFNPEVEIRPEVEICPLPFTKDLNEDTNFDDVFQRLASNPNVESLYSFFDGLWIRLFQGGDYQVPKDLSSRIVAVKKERGWCHMNKKYVEGLYTDRDTKLLIDPVKKCPELVCEEDHVNYIDFTGYLTAQHFVKVYFYHNTSLEFELADTRYADQKFVFSTTAMKGDNPDTFKMNLAVLDPDQSVSHPMPKLHVALQVLEKDMCDIMILPLCGKPTCDETKTYWNWGYLHFHDKQISNLEMIWGKGGPQLYNCGTDEKYGLVAYLVE